MPSQSPTGLPDYHLTPRQKGPLLAAMQSQPPSTTSSVNSQPSTTPGSLGNTPTQDAEGSGFDGSSPYADHKYDGNGDNDTSFELSFDEDLLAKIIDDLPESAGSTKSGSENNDNEKRSYPGDGDEEDGGDMKRHETGEKTPKKPGRKPLLTEPSSKRKAQNRAAQRAFRERKEKHLKDLETKVEELEKASASANHENSLLRAHVKKMSAELDEYKKRLTLVASNRMPNYAAPRPTFGNAVINNLPDVDFQFEFPKFGQVLHDPSPTATNSGSMNVYTSDSQSPRAEQTTASEQIARHASTASNSFAGSSSQIKAELTGILSPPLTNTNIASASCGSTGSHHSFALTTSSPSASSNSNGGTMSSCGTSPESFTQSPLGFKPLDTMATIGEEKLHGLGSTHQDFSSVAGLDMNFLTASSNFKFDPQLFGGYREPQEHIPGSGFDDSFFSDALGMDFTTPYFAPSPAIKKPDLMSRIDAAKNEDATEVVQTADGRLLTCAKIWEKLQNCPKVRSADFDLDGLCSDLQKKAKCTGSGAVVDETTFRKVMRKYLGESSKDRRQACTSESA